MIRCTSFEPPDCLPSCRYESASASFKICLQNYLSSDLLAVGNSSESSPLHSSSPRTTKVTLLHKNQEPSARDANVVNYIVQQVWWLMSLHRRVFTWKLKILPSLVDLGTPTALILTCDLDLGLQSPMSWGHDPCTCKNQGRRSLCSRANKCTNGHYQLHYWPGWFGQ